MAVASLVLTRGRVYRSSQRQGDYQLAQTQRQVDEVRASASTTCPNRLSVAVLIGSRHHA